VSDAVLAIKLGALGDMIQAFDALHDIRAHHRGDRVVLLTTPPFAPLAARMPWLDEVWSGGRPKATNIGAFVSLIARLRRARFRRVYDLQCNRRTALYFRLLSGAHRPQWAGTVDGADFAPAPATELRHNCDAMRATLAAAGVPVARPTDLAWLDADLSAFQLPARFALLVPGSSPHLPHKRWPAEAYAALGTRLKTRGLDIVLAGTAADRDAVARIVSLLPEARDLTGRTDLFQLAGIERRAAGVIGNDTGPVFLAAALGAPTLMLMSRHTDPRRSAPRGPLTAWLKRDDLATLSVDEVEHAVLTR
jgi:ADP-heptose:LPS heptosyltransferase